MQLNRLDSWPCSALPKTDCSVMGFLETSTRRTWKQFGRRAEYVLQCNLMHSEGRGERADNWTLLSDRRGWTIDDGPPGPPASRQARNQQHPGPATTGARMDCNYPQMDHIRFDIYRITSNLLTRIVSRRAEHPEPAD